MRWGNGGRPKAAPTKYGERSGLSVGAGHFHGLLRIFCGFGAHPHPSGLRPATFPLVGGRLGRAAKGRPYEIRGTLRPFRRGRTLSRSVEDFLRFRGPPSSVWPSASHLPPCRGKAGAGGHMGPPLRRKTGRVRWLINARRGCGAAPGAIFHEVRPQWAGGNLDCYSDFARRNDSDQPKG